MSAHRDRLPPVVTGEGDKDMEKLFTFDDAAESLGTSSRFVRKLVAERRIRHVRVGRLVRIPESALDEYVASGTVEPMTPRSVWQAKRVG